MQSTHSSRGHTPCGAIVLTFAAVALAGAASSGCNQSEAATRATPGDAPKTNGPGKARIDADNYVVEAKAVGPAKVGQESTIEINLTTKGDYHINKQYPYKFKTADPPPAGVTFPKPTLLRADGTFDEKTGKFKVPFVAAKAGKVTIGGTFSVSVCSDANCIMDKQNVDVDVDVK
jgi:hypothetical protein